MRFYNITAIIHLLSEWNSTQILVLTPCVIGNEPVSSDSDGAYGLEFWRNKGYLTIFMVLRQLPW